MTEPKPPSTFEVRLLEKAMREVPERVGRVVLEMLRHGQDTDVGRLHARLSFLSQPRGAEFDLGADKARLAVEEAAVQGGLMPNDE